MDVALLSRMIGELMPDLDSLSLPGLGTFRSEQMGASFSDKGYTINPPYRRLTFTSKETEDGLLAEAYASSNGITLQEADILLRSFTAVLAKELRSVKSVELPGLGRLRATREDHFFFVPDQDLDISPEACGLQSVSLKSHPAPLPPLPEIPVPPTVTAPAAIMSAAVGSQILKEGKAPVTPSDGVGTTPVHLAGEPEVAGSATAVPVHLAGEPEVAGTAPAAPGHLAGEPEDAGTATATPDNLARKAVEAGSAPADLGPYEREVGALPAGTAGTTGTTGTAGTTGTTGTAGTTVTSESVKSTVATEATGATGTAVTTEATVATGSAETPESATPTETSTPAVPARVTRGTAAKKARKPFPKPLAWTLGAVVAAAIFLGGFVVVSRLAPSFTDSLLYTPEQLAIINAPEDGADISR